MALRNAAKSRIIGVTAMSKICDRNYSANTMYTLKMIKGIACCPACEKPAICHHKSIEQRALYWSLSDDTGTSSKAIARWFALKEMFVPSMPPSDADDRGRCIRLLELIPEWLPRLDELKSLDAPDVKPTGITIGGSGITAYDNSWSKQIPLIVSEGNFARPK